MNKLLVCAALGLVLAATEIRYVHTTESNGGLAYTLRSERSGVSPLSRRTFACLTYL